VCHPPGGDPLFERARVLDGCAGGLGAEGLKPLLVRLNAFQQNRDTLTNAVFTERDTGAFRK
jgi:hypothetical protein